MKRGFALIIAGILVVMCVSGCNGRHKSDSVETEAPAICDALNDAVTDDMIEAFMREAHRDGSVAVVCVPVKLYKELLANASLERLYRNAYAVYYARLSDDSQMIEYRKDGQLSSKKESSGSLRIDEDPSTPLTVSLVELASNDESLKDLISLKSLGREVDYRVIIYCLGYPLVVWVKSVDEYFITVDEKEIGMPASQIDNPAYDPVYRVYEKDDFIFSFISAKVKIEVSGQPITAAADQYGNLLEIPLLSVLDALDIACSWVSEFELLEIKLKNDTYELDLIEARLTNSQNGCYYGLAAPGGINILEHRDEEVFVDYDSFCKLLLVFNIKTDYNGVERVLYVD